EFDSLANAWNSLLDYRDTATGQNAILSTILENIPVGIEVCDAEASIEYANPAYLKMTGYSLAEVIGKNPNQLLASPSVKSGSWGDALVAISKGETWSAEIVSRRKDGSDFISSAMLSPVHNEQGELVHVVTVRQDITRQKARQKELKEARMRAEMADKAKSEFIANMSHELRTPLNAIIGFSEMLAEQKLGPLGNPQYVEFAGMAAKASHALLGSINSILDLSRLDSGTARIDKDKIDVARTLRKVIKTKAGRAEKRGIKISFSCEGNPQIATDELRFRQSISFLLCNAIKFNSKGGKIDIKCTRAGNNDCIISISDTGIGIAPEALEHVTDAFFRADNEFNRTEDGIGLGLTLVKRFADSENADLKITSQPGKGTCVTLTFHASAEAEEPEEENTCIPCAPHALRA
ncbi:MAG TPA: PAS domain S-box protein, partial [Rhizobiales bacterium]|nr:PAS domain S-box protein [Hyphomicrobiales bacterium]